MKTVPTTHPVLVQDMYEEKGDFYVGSVCVSILIRTANGRYHLEYDNGDGWKFKTVGADFDLRSL